jgi:hypothetical protein
MKKKANFRDPKWEAGIKEFTTKGLKCKKGHFLHETQIIFFDLLIGTQNDKTGTRKFFIWFQPKLRCWESKIEGSGFESCRPLVVKLFLSNWGDSLVWFHWVPAHRAPPGLLLACCKNNRVEKSVVQIYTKNSHQKWLVKMVIHQNWLVHQKKNYLFGKIFHSITVFSSLHGV